MKPISIALGATALLAIGALSVTSLNLRVERNRLIRQMDIAETHNEAYAKGLLNIPAGITEVCGDISAEYTLFAKHKIYQIWQIPTNKEQYILASTEHPCHYAFEAYAGDEAYATFQEGQPHKGYPPNLADIYSSEPGLEKPLIHGQYFPFFWSEPIQHQSIFIYEQKVAECMEAGDAKLNVCVQQTRSC